MDADRARDLLLADVALATGAADAPRLGAAIEGGSAGGLADALVREGVLTPEARAKLEEEVGRVVAAAGGDPVVAVARRGGVARALHESLRPETSASLVSEGAVARAPLRPIAPGRYRDFSIVGEGGMGLVYLALDTELNRRVALKIVRATPQGADKPETPDTPLLATPPGPERVDASRSFEELKVRFLQEAWVTGALEHPGVVPVYELGHTDAGVPYYTMRYVRGERTLATAIHEARHLDARLSLLEPFLKVCDTIAYAHARGIIHRDLKPENIALGEFGEAVVLDWGLAKARGQPDVTGGQWRARIEELRAATELRTVAGAMGTAGYMSPEAAMGSTEDVDERSDVYSLGAILFEMLTGRTPLRFANFLEYVRALVAQDPPSALEVDDAIPEPLAQACARALAREREDRYASVGEMAHAIRRWQTEGRLEEQAAELLGRAREELLAARRGSGNVVLWHLDRASAACTKALHLHPGDPDASALSTEIRQLRDRGIRERMRTTRRWAVVVGGFVVLATASIFALYLARRLANQRAEAQAQVEMVRAEVADRERDVRRAREETQAARARAADLLASLSENHLRENRVAAARLTAARAVAQAPTSAGWRALAAAEGRWAPTLVALLETPGVGPLAYGSDGRLYAAAGPQVRVLEGGRTAWTTTFAAGASPVRLLAVSGDGRRLATVGEDGVTQVLGTADGSKVTELLDVSQALKGGRGTAMALALEADGSRVYVGYDSGLIIGWTTGDGSMFGFRLGEGVAVTALATEVPGEYFYAGHADGGVERITLTDFGTSMPMAAAAAPIHQIVPSEDGEYVHVASLDHQLRSVEFDGGGALTEYQAPAGLSKLVLATPDRSRLLAAGHWGALDVWSCERPADSARVLPDGGPNVTGVAVSPDGKLLAVGTGDGLVHVYALDGRWPPEGAEPATALVTSGDGRHTYVARPDRTIEAWDNETGQQVARPASRSGTICAFALTADHLYAAALDGRIEIWALRDATPEFQSALQVEVPATAICVAPGSGELVVGRLDGHVALWNAQGRRRVALLEGEEGPPVARVVVADGRIEAWDVLGRQRTWDASTRSRLPVRPGKPPALQLTGKAPALAGSRLPWVQQDARARLIDFENRYGLKLRGAEVVAVPLPEYQPLRPRIDSWSR